MRSVGEFCVRFVWGLHGDLPEGLHGPCTAYARGLCAFFIRFLCSRGLEISITCSRFARGFCDVCATFAWLPHKTCMRFSFDLDVRGFHWLDRLVCCFHSLDMFAVSTGFAQLYVLFLFS